jgi:hypothetical protein
MLLKAIQTLDILISYNFNNKNMTGDNDTSST